MLNSLQIVSARARMSRGFKGQRHLCVQWHPQQPVEEARDVAVHAGRWLEVTPVVH
jgi:hypothetical protein